MGLESLPFAAVITDVAEFLICANCDRPSLRSEATRYVNSRRFRPQVGCSTFDSRHADERGYSSVGAAATSRAFDVRPPNGGGGSACGMVGFALRAPAASAGAAPKLTTNIVPKRSLSEALQWRRDLNHLECSCDYRCREHRRRLVWRDVAERDRGTHRRPPAAWALGRA
jgi:hypothetical protein